MAEPIVVGEQRSNQRVIRLAAVAAIVLVVGFVAPKLLFGGGGGDVVEDALPPVPTTVAGPSDGEPAPAETFEAFAAKNPFTPLVELGSPAPAADTTATTVPPVDPGFVTFPDDGSQLVVLPDGSVGFDSGSPTPTTTPPPTVPVRQPDRVALLEVYAVPDGSTVASVRIDDVTYQVGVQDEFAAQYRVLSLDLGSRCGAFLFADERFRLCEGDEVSK